MTAQPRGLRRLIGLGGTASRKRAWLFFLLFLATVAATQILAVRQLVGGRVLIPLLGIVTTLWLIAAVQRLHDAGRSGRWALLLVVPVVSLVASLVILLLPPRPGAVPKAHPLLRGLAGTGLALFLLVTLSRAFWMPYWIPAGSMKPTLLVGDFLVATPARFANLKRGDVVVFRHPLNGQSFIKRVIGLPGDTVQMTRGVLYLNGTKVARKKLGTFAERKVAQGPAGQYPRCTEDVVGEGGMCHKALWRETLPGGTAYDILEISDTGIADTTPAFTVPQGTFFVLGDNRDNSMDSRFSQSVGGIGFVPAENLIGRAVLVLFSSAGRSLYAVSDWRPGRYLKVIR